jgi:hypothetical protein
VAVFYRYIFSIVSERRLCAPHERGESQQKMNRDISAFEKAELYLLRAVLFLVFVYELYQFVKFVLTH